MRERELEQIFGIAPPVTSGQQPIAAQQPINREQELEQIFGLQAPVQPVEVAPPQVPPQASIQALPLALQDLALQVGGVEPLVKMLGQPTPPEAVVPEIAGGVGGGLLGAKLGAPFGPVGGIIGGIAGGIIGSTVGKTVQQQLDITQPKASVGENIAQSSLEEAVGRMILTGLGVAGRIVAPILDPLISGGKRLLADKFGVSFSTAPVEELFITSKSIDPTDVSGGDIITAQENLLGKRLLTTFEETGGEAGDIFARDLADKINESRRVISTDSAYLTNRKLINDRIGISIRPGKSIEAIDNEFKRAINNTFTSALKSFGGRFDIIKKELIPLRTKVKVPVPPEIMDNIRSKIPAMRESGNADKNINKLIKVIEKILFKPVKKLDPEQVKKLSILRESLGQPPLAEVPIKRELKSFLTFKELKQLDNNITAALPKFSDSKTVQDRLAGAYSGEIKPILADLKSSALLADPSNKQLKRIIELEVQFGELAELKGSLVNSKVGKALGLTEKRQVAKAVKPQRIANVVFENLETWQQTKNILNQVNPALVGPLEDAFRTRILREAFDPKKKEFTFERLSKLREKYGDELILDAAGANYLKAVKDSQLITSALAKTDQLVQSQAALSPQDKIIQNTIRFFLHPIAGTVAVFQGIMSKMRVGLGLGVVNDKHIFNMMQGERGQRLIENSMTTFMSDPKAYNNYVQIVRELSKTNPDLEIESVDQETFGAEMGAYIGDLVNIFGQGEQ